MVSNQGNIKAFPEGKCQSFVHIQGDLIHKNYQMEGGGGEIPYDQDGTGTGWNW
jgi:hypothetical protein